MIMSTPTLPPKRCFGTPSVSTRRQQRRRRLPIIWRQSISVALLVAALLVALLADKIQPVHCGTYFNFNSNHRGGNSYDPYQILGIAKTATTAEIKTAYRRKARETHPDKNPSPDAAAQFHQIQKAYELLSDPVQRRQHDLKHQPGNANRRARTQEETRRRQQQRRQQQQQQQRRQQPTEADQEADFKRQTLQDPAFRAAKDAVQYVQNLDQLKGIVVDPRTGRLKKNVMLVFVGNKLVEKFVDETLMFPHKYAGQSGGGIPWQDLTTTIKVRYIREKEVATDLIRFFNVHVHPFDLKRGRPFIVYGHAGTRLDEYVTWEPGHVWKRRQALDAWTDKQQEARVAIVNPASSGMSVSFYKLVSTKVNQRHGRPPTYRQEIMEIARLRPGESLPKAFARVGDVYIARDARVDYQPGTTMDKNSAHRYSNNSTLAYWNITQADNTHRNIVLNVRPEAQGGECYDMNSQCGMFKNWPTHRCHAYPEYMNGMCALSCGQCQRRTTNERGFGITEHAQQLTSWLRSAFSAYSKKSRDTRGRPNRLFTTIQDSLQQVPDHHKIALALLSFGLFLMGVYYSRPITGLVHHGQQRQPQQPLRHPHYQQQPSDLLYTYYYYALYAMLIVLGLTVYALTRLEQQPFQMMKSFDTILLRDVRHIWKHRKGAAFLIIGLGFVPSQLSWLLQRLSLTMSIRNKKGDVVVQTNSAKGDDRLIGVALGVCLVAAVAEVALRSLATGGASSSSLNWMAFLLKDVQHIGTAKKLAGAVFWSLGLVVGGVMPSLSVGSPIVKTTQPSSPPPAPISRIPSKASNADKLS